MQELDKAFVAKNKKALLEEIAIQLSKSQDLVDLASTNPDGLAGAFVGLSACVGKIDSYFKEYVLLRRGEMPVQRLIGFAAFDADESDGYGTEDANDTELPAEPKSSKHGK